MVMVALLETPAFCNYTVFLHIGLLMLLDVFHERGMHMAEYDWGDADECRFPLFDFLKPLRLEYMYMIYFILILG